jgi:uncharacterized protein (DUF58 family)
LLTRSGLGVAVTAVTLVVCGWWWAYGELVVAGSALAVAVAIAVWSARASVRTTVDRTIASPRVARGDPVRATYRIVNPGRRRSAPMVLVDTLTESPAVSSHHPDPPPPHPVAHPAPGPSSSRWLRHDRAARNPVPPVDVGEEAPIEVRVELPPVDGLDRTECTGLIPTRRRGTFTVGPWSIERIDPLGLAVGRRAGDQTSPVIVHPRIHQLRGPYGAMHTVEDEAVIRKAASDPLSGFVSLREYVDGDDPRLIHWPTSARMGTLMLREHVELRRPEFTVVLDCSDRAATTDDFEEMVDVAASIAVHALRSGVNVSLKTTSRFHPGAMRPIERETRILDLLTPVGQVDDDHHMSLVEIFHAGIDHTMIMFVTGPTGPSTTLVHTDRVATVRVGQGSTPGRGVVLAVDDAMTFAERWRPWP